MIIAEVVTLFFYVISIWFLPEYFGSFSVAVLREIYMLILTQICRLCSLRGSPGRLLSSSQSAPYRSTSLKSSGDSYPLLQLANSLERCTTAAGVLDRWSTARSANCYLEQRSTYSRLLKL